MGYKVKVFSRYYIWHMAFLLANLSLVGTTRNITPQIFVTHPTSRQHKTHIKKNIHSKLFMKRFPKSCRIQKSCKNLNLQKNVFWCGKWMHKEKVLGMSHKGFFWLRTQKDLFFGNFSWMLIFENTSNVNLLDVFYR
jgi:hypothetical protein